jgi:hypothetical protein
MSNFSKPAWDKYILNPAFKYIPAASTDIRDTFRRAKMELNSTTRGQDIKKPLVLNPDGFVLSVDWFTLED